MLRGWNRRKSESPAASTPSLHLALRKSSVVPLPMPSSELALQSSTLGASPSQAAMRTSPDRMSAMRRFSRVLLGHAEEAEAPRRKSSLRAMADLFSATSFRIPKTEIGQASFVEHGLDASHAEKSLLILTDGSLDAELPSIEFVKDLVSHVALRVQPYLTGDEFQTEGTPEQISLAIKEHILSAIRNVRDLPTYAATDKAAEASLSVAVIHRGNKSEPPRLYSFTIGDVKTLVVRNEQLVFESAALIHGFNTPACVASQSIQSFESECLYECFLLEPKDTVMLLSDGVADNVYGHEIVAALESEPTDMDAAANAILQVAIASFEHPLNGHSPFSMAASTELYRQVDTDPAKMAQYAHVIQKDTNLKFNPLTRFASTFLGEHYELDILAMLASTEAGHSDDATVLLCTV
ncbi:hypothetical protein SPRG_10612 [Saprolegnia parasitica CBS 223.65]|uniref:Protein phosphatase n=1 Tax=Saprolegnia parasitica (strain CBS 223.65) TaxID=695850 RepID=A0A067C0B7_SAPPC|nr:hypothetical protein SPRG_10612 [Saprolegnia parasitica CBS 223.65]KDO24184.1 hypothetical protein SPRG_10612 [Saprolegnia parasitica CBS 223.65]|eukprot:XP_012205128.1 hypothetical protein SPRG_10612 [Saprolegnia parasitica CBS 223.65]